MNHLDGIAGRALGQRLNGSRERKDRLAANDNAASAAKAARVDEGEEAPALAIEAGAKPAPNSGYSRRRLE